MLCYILIFALAMIVNAPAWFWGLYWAALAIWVLVKMLQALFSRK